MTEEKYDTQEGEFEEKDVELFEFELDEEQIDELIEKLSEIRSTKESAYFSIDEDNDMLIHHSDGIEEMEEEENDA